MKYFDNRYNEWRTIPNCERLGLAWDSQSQRCAPGSAMLGRMLGDVGDFDFYDQYFYDTGNYDGGAYSDYLNFDDLYGSEGGYTPGIDYAPYDPMDLNPPDYGLPDLPTFGNDVWYVEPDYSATQPQSDWQAYYESFGYDPFDIFETISTYEPENPPNVGNWPSVPYQGYLPSFETPPYIPYEPPAPEPPQLPQSPASQQSNLPPACPGGQYHPYPIGHPQQNICVPFPNQQTQQPTKPQPQTGGGSSSGGSSSGSKPQTPQNCASNQCKHPTTGQCITTPQGYYRDPQTQICRPIPQQQQQTCPAGQYRSPSTGQCRTIPQCGVGTVFDQRTERCVPTSQAQQPLCPSGYYPNYDTRRCEKIPACEPGLVFDPNAKQCVLPSQLTPNPEGEILNSLKSVPLWLWLAGLGAFLLLGKDNEGRTTTVRYRRAS